MCFEKRKEESRSVLWSTASKRMICCLERWCWIKQFRCYIQVIELEHLFFCFLFPFTESDIHFFFFCIKSQNAVFLFPFSEPNMHLFIFLPQVTKCTFNKCRAWIFIIVFLFLFTKPNLYFFLFPPQVTKCTFHKYGSSGTVETHDGLCILPLNIFNEKIYIFLWFWFVSLAVVSGVGLLYRLATFIPTFRQVNICHSLLFLP